jgi:hypothetical protein
MNQEYAEKNLVLFQHDLTNLMGQFHKKILYLGLEEPNTNF